mmetsp:Transcript_8818/g.14314  ORF Transcript_8818/g.14314 Transcript_8818/m.14314 type:complete len:242 (-) Transcript_8818:2787-3512(-)
MKGAKDVHDLVAKLGPLAVFAGLICTLLVYLCYRRHASKPGNEVKQFEMSATRDDSNGSVVSVEDTSIQQVGKTRGGGLNRDDSEITVDHGDDEVDREALYVEFREKARETFRSKPTVNGADFETWWAKSDEVEVWGATVEYIPQDAEFRELFHDGNVHCLASGEVGDIQKFYFYGCTKRKKMALAMAEVSLSLKTNRLTCVFKDTDAANAAEESVFTAFMKLAITRKFNQESSDTVSCPV